MYEKKEEDFFFWGIFGPWSNTHHFLSHHSPIQNLDSIWYFNTSTIILHFIFSCFIKDMVSEIMFFLKKMLISSQLNYSHKYVLVIHIIFFKSFNFKYLFSYWIISLLHFTGKLYIFFPFSLISTYSSYHYHLTKILQLLYNLYLFILNNPILQSPFIINFLKCKPDYVIPLFNTLQGFLWS